MNAHTKEMLGKRAFEGSKTLSALHLKAAEKGQIKTIEDALLMSTHIDAASPVDGRTALHAASAGGAAEMVRYLIEGGANVNARTKQQQTPLHLTASVEAAQALLEGGADPKLKDYAKQTPATTFKAKKLTGDAAAGDIRTLLDAWQANPDALEEARAVRAAKEAEAAEAEVQSRLSAAQAAATAEVERLRRTVQNPSAASAALGRTITTSASTLEGSGEMGSPLLRLKTHTRARPSVDLLRRVDSAVAQGVAEGAEQPAALGMIAAHQPPAPEPEPEPEPQPQPEPEPEPEPAPAPQPEPEPEPEPAPAPAAEEAKDSGGGGGGSVFSRLAPNESVSRLDVAHEPWEVDIPEDEITFDEYEDCIGIGGQGAVYKAKWLHTTVAVKRVPIDPDDPVRDKKNVDDLQKEGRLLSALKHPHVLLFLGCHFSWPNFYMVTELVEGPMGRNNLRKVLDSTELRPLLSWSLRARLLHDVAMGAAFLHSRQTMHRDLKASNILVDAALRCKIADFGLSRIIDTKIKKGSAAFKGKTTKPGETGLSRQLTKKYNLSAIIPPEVMAGEKYDFKVDCFSLGVVTVEVLTNKQAEEIPRVEFSMSGRNKHAHMGIGAVDEKKLRPMLDAVLAGDDPAPATLVEMAMACLKSVARDRPAMGELCEELARVRAALPPCEVVVSPRQPA